MKKIGIVIVVLLLGVGIGLLYGRQGETEEDKEVMQDELAFDVDLSSLTYALPSYTHTCIPKIKTYCNEDGSCEPMKAEVFLLVDVTNEKYSRCDNNPCDTYDATFSKSGIYTVISPLLPNHGEIKIAESGDYTETNSLGMTTYISKGTCSLPAIDF